MLIIQVLGLILKDLDSKNIWKKKMKKYRKYTLLIYIKNNKLNTAYN